MLAIEFVSRNDVFAKPKASLFWQHKTSGSRWTHKTQKNKGENYQKHPKKEAWGQGGANNRTQGQTTLLGPFSSLRMKIGFNPSEIPWLNTLQYSPINANPFPEEAPFLGPKWRWGGWGIARVSFTYQIRLADWRKRLWGSRTFLPGHVRASLDCRELLKSRNVVLTRDKKYILCLEFLC